MRLQEIVDILQNTELKQIVVGESLPQVISLLNLALIEVYGRFQILQEEQIIDIVTDQTKYSLYDKSQAVLQVLLYDPKLITAGAGHQPWKQVPVNDIQCDESVFTPTPHILHVPRPEAGRKYSVMQVVTPPYVTEANKDTLEFIVPAQYLEAITSYAAFRAYKSMNGSEQSEIASHYKFYEQSCNNVLKRGLTQQSIMTNLKLSERGFNS